MNKDNNDNIVIGVEGLVGAGKTSICKELLNYIPNSVVLHASDVYRAVVYKVLDEMKKSQSELEGEKKKNHLEDIKNINIRDLIDKFKIAIKVENRETVVYFGDEKVDIKLLQSAKNSMAVSQIAGVANNKEAYEYVKTIIDSLKEKYNVIFSGRDTFKIYKNLDYHFFITASIEERVRRKLIQYNNELDEKEVRENIEKRDLLQKQAGYYNIYENTITIDVTDCKTIEEATKKVAKNINLKN